MKQTATPALKKETAQKYYEVDVRNIQPLDKAGGNIREDYGDSDGSFQETVDSIRENGIIMPLRGYRDKTNPEIWHTTDGHRRVKAAMKLYNEEGIVIRARIVNVGKMSDLVCIEQ